MRRAIAVIAVVFVVRWMTGAKWEAVPCVTPEPEKVICVTQVPMYSQQEFKQEEAARAFAKAMEETQKGIDVSVERRKT